MSQSYSLNAAKPGSNSGMPESNTQAHDPLIEELANK